MFEKYIISFSTNLLKIPWLHLSHRRNQAFLYWFPWGASFFIFHNFSGRFILLINNAERVNIHTCFHIVKGLEQPSTYVLSNWDISKIKNNLSLIPRKISLQNNRGKFYILLITLKYISSTALIVTKRTQCHQLVPCEKESISIRTRGILCFLLFSVWSNLPESGTSCYIFQDKHRTYCRR